MRLMLMAGAALAVSWAALPAPVLAEPTLANSGPPAPLPARHAMIAAANADAADAALKVLKRGGSAVDAAVAIQAVLGLEEPESSGVGGGAFMVYYDAKTRRTTVYDGREIAPAAADTTLFLGPDGKPLPYLTAILSGHSTGVPGAIAMLDLAHKAHGKLAWSGLFSDAERLAKKGFVVSPKLGRWINSPVPMGHTPDANAYFTKPDGSRYQTGETLKNPAYAKTLRLIGEKGSKALYEGKLAEDIIAKTHEGPMPGALTLADFKAYHPIERAALCRPYRAYVVCLPGAPAGGVGTSELLGLLEHTDIATRGANDPQAWYAFAQASRLAYADRDYFEGDPAFVAVPTAGLNDPAYDKQRAALIDTLGPGAPAHGDPPGAKPHASDATHEPGGTTSFVVVDAGGNVVSMTTTVESLFGCGRMVGGFFLNNQLTDFSMDPVAADGTLAANAPGPHKRPRSSMSPAIVFDRQGHFVLAVGSPGGNSIIAYVAKALVAMLDWKLSPQEAVALPNIVARGAVVSVEAGEDAKVVAYLTAKGLPVRPDQGENSGLEAVRATPKGYVAGVDPRRPGKAEGY
ncbi:MAG: gamma-glutamyltransferase family protein [Pseudomonadota bacterium]|jgi:gamma-glutamyltranspeptidase/glutathione hydrolase